jgi:hypothetical protein
MNLRIWITRVAMKQSTRRPVPVRIPMSGKDRIATRNYTMGYLATAPKEWKFYVEKVTPEGLDGQWFETIDARPEPRSIPNADLTNYRTEFVQYLRELEIWYDSAWEYALYQWLGVPSFKFWRNRIAQFFYDQTPLVKKDRMKVLGHFLEKTQQNDEYKGWSQKLMTEFYGPRWSQNEANSNLYFYYDTVLASLVETGELKKLEYGFQITPQALVTMERYEEETKRHAEMARLQRWMLGITVVLVGIGLLQAYSSIVAADKSIWSVLDPFNSTVDQQQISPR